MYKITHDLLKMEESTGGTRAKAADFVKCMESFEFVIVTVVIQHIGFVKSLSVELQKSIFDLVQVPAEANRRKVVISKQRSESACYGLCKCPVANCWNSQSVTRERPCSTTSNRQKNRAVAETHMTEAYFRKNVFYPFDDHITSEMERHFPNELNHPYPSSFLFHVLDCYNIHKVNEYVLGSVARYVDLPCKGSLMQEVDKWKQKTEDHGMVFITLTQSMAAANWEFFASINHMSKTLLTIPVSSCCSECSFSALRCLTTWLRSATSQNRFNSLTSLHIQYIEVLMWTETTLWSGLMHPSTE